LRLHLQGFALRTVKGPRRHGPEAGQAKRNKAPATPVPFYFQRQIGLYPFKRKRKAQSKK
jgi:hypothetical protein